MLEDDTTGLQVKHQQDNLEKHSDEVQMKNAQYKQDVIDAGQQAQHALCDTEETILKQRHNQDKHEKHLKEILLVCIQLDQEWQTRQNQVRNVDKSQRHFEVGSHSKQEEETLDMYETYPNANPREHTSEANYHQRRKYWYREASKTSQRE
jgi:hypothetical protein